jgi:hypothetical protein
MSNGFKKVPTREELLAIVKETPSGLEGLQESQWLDFKRDPHLKPGGKTEDRHRFELAKDVTAMANSGGGVIVWGVTEVEDPEGVRKLVGRIVPIPRGVVDEGQVRRTLREWVFPTYLHLDIRECEVNGGGSVWVIDIPPQASAHLPFVVVREWPPGKDDKSSARGHVTMYRRSGTDNAHVPAEELHRWLHRGYPGLGSAGAMAEPSTIYGGEGVPQSERRSSGALVSTSAEALAEELDLLGVQDGDAYYFIQLTPAIEGRVPRFFDTGQGGFQGRFSGFKSLRPSNFGPFSSYALLSRTPSNALRRGIVASGGVNVRDSGLSTFVCCQKTLTWASDKFAPEGQLVINPIALPEFTLEACRFFSDEVLPSWPVPSRPDECKWRVGVASPRGASKLYLPKGRPEPISVRASWFLSPPAKTETFESDFRTTTSSDGARLAFEVLCEVFHHFGYDSEAIPFQVDGAIDSAAIGAIR